MGVMRGKTRSNAMSDFVNWICVMQAFDGEILCMLMYANVSVKTRPYPLSTFCPNPNPRR